MTLSERPTGQTAVKEEQFYALEEFSKYLETFFQAFPEARRLYYERRTQQYGRLSIEKTRIVTPANMIRAFASMFLCEPHRATRNYAGLKSKVGDEIFAKDHKMDPYYTSAFALYKLEYLFRTNRLDAKYKSARFHILLALRLLAGEGLCLGSILGRWRGTASRSWKLFGSQPRPLP